MDHTNASTKDRPHSVEQTSRSLRVGVWLLLVAGGMFVVHGLGFIYRTYYTDGFELGVDQLDGYTAAELATTHPEVVSYVEHLHVSFAGLMIAAGLGIGLLAWFGVRARHQWALATVLVIPLVFGAFSIPIHQTVHFHFDALLHLGPAAVGFPILVVGAMLSWFGLRSARESAETAR